jgi:hypothetical protein
MTVCCPGWIRTPIQPCRGRQNILRISSASNQFFFTRLFLNFLYVDHVHSILGWTGFKFQCPWLWLPFKNSDFIFLLYCSINLLFSNYVHSASRLVSKAVIKVMWLSGKPCDNKVIVNWSAIFLPKLAGSLGILWH